MLRKIVITIGVAMFVVAGSPAHAGGDPVAACKATKSKGAGKKASDLLKALSHESRLLILCLLAEGEKSVSELEAIMSMPQAAVSQQLARLRFDKIVKTRRDGRVIHYSIASEEVSSLVDLLYQFFCRPVRGDRRSRR